MSSLNLIHCSYHKCMTVYFSRVMSAVFNRCLPWSAGYRHFNSHLNEFVEQRAQYRLVSINNRHLDLETLGDFRLSRFVRDPRDLVVSGYFYHRRGAENWVTMKAPTPQDWYFANGALPQGLEAHGGSFASYLQDASKEDGLMAELEFRRPHFESMMLWPIAHPNVVTYKYEELVGREDAVLCELFDFYEFSKTERALGRFFAKRYSIRQQVKADAHVRNPTPGQWRKHFTDRITSAFTEQHEGLLEHLGYPTD